MSILIRRESSMYFGAAWTPRHTHEVQPEQKGLGTVFIYSIFGKQIEMTFHRISWYFCSTVMTLRHMYIF